MSPAKGGEMETPVRSVYNEKLSLKNRSVWILRSKAAITAAKAGGALSKPRDDTNADKHESGKSVIVNLLEDGDLDLWEKHDDINELYKALEKRYKDMMIARKPVLWKQLSSVKMKPGESLRSYMKRIKDLVAELKECGDTVSDSNAITHALTGLTSSYKQFTNSFFAIAMPKDLEELEGKLLLVEQQVEAEATEATTVSLYAGQERFNNRNNKGKRDDGGNSNNNDSGFRGRCYNCGQRGHRSADCKKPKEDKPFCTYCKKTGHTLAQCWSAPRKREEKKVERDEDEDFPKDGAIFMFLPTELVESPVDPQVMVAKTEDYDLESQVEAAIWSWEPSGDLPCGDNDDMLEMRVVVPREVTVAAAIEPSMVEPLEQSAAAAIELPMVEPLEQSAAAAIELPMVELLEQSAAAAIELPMVEPLEQSAAAAIELPMVEPLEQSAAAAIELPMVEPLEQSVAAEIESPEELLEELKASMRKRLEKYIMERLAELMEEPSMEPEVPFLDDHKVTSSSEVVLPMGAISQMMIDYVDWLEKEWGMGATTPAAMVVPQSKGETLLCDKSASGLNCKRLWFVDSGSFYHVTPDKDSLQNYCVLEEPIALTPVTGKPLYAIGYGDVVLRIDSSRSLHAFRQDRTGEPVLITVKGVFHVPEFHFRLISLKQLTARGAEYSGYGSSMSVFHQHEDWYFEVSCKLSVYAVRAQEMTSARHGKPVAAVLPVRDRAKLWHSRYGHLSYFNVARLVEEKMVTGIDVVSDRFRELGTSLCVECVMANHPRKPFHESDSRAERCLELVHMDLCGPMSVESQAGNLYVATFLDDYSGLSAVVF
ncbi:hypothetical protein VaNZ11_004078 [Volvox africanus]|uniref:CCHC-type domain-containing protein n=1 Tax=Volvox africanus TaxID=51714 RepID=A0ABQ5RWU5_9CHLO|nr:hypothetical protein VaNZ11_004078 [Volvox africanus]